jgi:hypothetical protein
VGYRSTIFLAFFALSSISARGAAQDAPDQAPREAAVSPETSDTGTVTPGIHPVSTQPQPVVAASHPTQKSEGSVTSTMGRIIGESFFGILGNGLIWGSLYSDIPWFIMDRRKCDDRDCSDFADIRIFLSSIAGVPAALTVPLGVYLFGTKVHQNGRYDYTFLGHLAGMAAGFGSGYLLTELFWSPHSNNFPVGPMTVAAVMQVTGAIVGYELSLPADQPDEGKKSASSSDGLTLMPVASLTPQGAMVGLNGVF